MYRIISSGVLHREGATYKLLSQSEIEFEEKSITLISGGNGIGKSSFIESILSYNQNKKNTTNISETVKNGIFFETDIYKSYNNNEIKLSDQERENFTKRTSYLRQSLDYSLMKMKIKDFIIFYLRGSVEDKLLKAIFEDDKFQIFVDSLLRIFYTDEVTQKTKFNINTKIKIMSGGEFQSLMVLATFVRARFSDFIILDEPFNNLSYTHKQILLKLIDKLWEARNKISFIVVSHLFIIDLEKYSNSRFYKYDKLKNKFVISSYNIIEHVNISNDTTADFENLDLGRYQWKDTFI